MMHARTIVAGTLAAAALVTAGLVTASQTAQSDNGLSDLALQLRTPPNGMSGPWKMNSDPYPASSRRTDPVAAPFLADLFDRGEQGPGRHTAVYAIATQAVYLPDGRVLEAHSGLGSHADNPLSARVRNRGATPPNVYELSLRERLFHGVRAIRLQPSDRRKMFGRDGMLAHPYMLRGARAQSNGCVVFDDYPAFLQAYLNGEVRRLVVVDRPANAGVAWLANRVKKLRTILAAS
jgi:hypothetical protein